MEGLVKGALMEFKKITFGELNELPSFEIDHEYSSYADSLTEEQYDFIALLVDTFSEDDLDYFFETLYSDPVKFHAWMTENKTFESIIKRFYEHMIACGNAQACCNLGNMYHDTNNEGSKEDYEKAIELYTLGGERGDDQSLINLGYIYYYGRGTKRNYSRAYQCFAHATFISNNPEAYWKLGDLYASGKGVRKSDATAWQLYLQAYECAGETPLAGRAAHHMADYLLKGIKGTLDPDPEVALMLYTKAEVCYYTLIDTGLTYYQRQLEQAIEGQQRARAAIQGQHYLHRMGAKAPKIILN